MRPLKNNLRKKPTVKVWRIQKAHNQSAKLHDNVAAKFVKNVTHEHTKTTIEYVYNYTTKYNSHSILQKE